MNAAADLLAEAAAHGIRLEARIWVDRLDRLPPGLRDKLRHARAELLALLAAQPARKSEAGSAETAATAKPISHAMPVSWPESHRIPQPGAYCRMCSGRSWWTRTSGLTGWCCSTCHPPPGLEPSEFITRQTP